MATRSVLGLSYTANLFKAKGFDSETVLKKHGLNSERIDANARISRSKELEIYQSLFELCPDPLLGLEVGPLLGPAGYGPFAMLLTSCKDGYESCQLGMRYQAMGYAFGEVSLELNNDLCALRLDAAMIPEDLREFILYRDLSGTTKLMRDIYMINGMELSIPMVHLKVEAPKDISKFKAAFQCPVSFGQAENRIYIATQDLKRPFPQANTSAAEMYREQCENILFEASKLDRSLREALRNYLMMFSYEIPKANEAARTFGMSERTLRRRLNEEESSFQNVLDAVRYEKAKRWLSDSALGIELIALKLGYQEAAAFNHAFKRWSATSPSKYRKSQSNK